MKRKRTNPLFLLILIITSYILLNVVSIYSYSRIDETRNSDVAIVLGAASSDNYISPVFKERLNHGISLYESGTVSKIILTGGYAEGNKYSDSYTASKYLTENGIPQEAILLEEKSTITEENLFYAKQIMDENNLKTALIVSDPIHMKRAMLISKDCGIDGFSSPTKTSMYRGLDAKTKFLSRELCLYIGYKWFRYFEKIYYFVRLEG